MNILVDTCIILDYLQNREPFFDDALNLAIGAANREYGAFVPASALTDLFYIIHKYNHSNIETRKVVNDLTKIFGLTDTLAEDCINALHNGMDDFEDAVMSETAHRIGVDFIVTRNLKDYKGSKVRAITPSDFLAKLDS